MPDQMRPDDPNRDPTRLNDVDRADPSRDGVHHDQESHGETPHEQRDIGLGLIALAGVLTLVMIGIVLLASGALVTLFASGQPAAAATPGLPPEPRLQVAPGADWQTIKATQEAGLSQYGWIDESAGIVQIPIDRAMELLAGTYTVTPANSPTPAATATTNGTADEATPATTTTTANAPAETPPGTPPASTENAS